MSGHNHAGTVQETLPDIWTLIEEAEYSQKCGLCEQKTEEGGPIYHNPRTLRGFKVRHAECHDAMPGWREITAPPAEPEPEPAGDLSNVLARVLLTFDDGELTPDGMVVAHPEHETIIRTVWAALERDVLIAAAKARSKRA